MTLFARTPASRTRAERRLSSVDGVSTAPNVGLALTIALVAGLFGLSQAAVGWFATRYAARLAARQRRTELVLTALAELQDALVRAFTAGSEYILNINDVPRDEKLPKQAAWGEGRRSLVEPLLAAQARALYLIPTVDDQRVQDLAREAMAVVDAAMSWDVDAGFKAWQEDRDALEIAVRCVADSRRALLIDYPTGDGWAAEAWRRVKASGTAPADDANTPARS